MDKYNIEDNTDYIESYFKGGASDAQKEQFEKKIMEDALFAGEVAFYISANGVMQQQRQEEKKQRFREIYEQQKVVSMKQPVRNMWKYVAAASVIIAALILSWLFSGDKTSPQQLADKYIEQHWKTEHLPVTMSGSQDSLQSGLKLFNDKKLPEALAIFEILARDSANSEAKKYAGIASLCLRNYDKALKYFTMIDIDSSYSNWGTFYKALTLLERNKTGDKEAAKVLLQRVRDNELEGKPQAEEWLKKIE